MKLVIDIDDKVYRLLERENFINMTVQEIHDTIRKGVPYDRQKCNECILNEGNGNCVLDGIPCIYLALEYVEGRKTKNERI